MESAEKLMRQSAHFRVINEIDPLDQIANLNIDFVLKFIMYIAVTQGVGSRFHWKFNGLNYFIVYMPIPTSLDNFSLEFRVDWKSETYFLISLNIDGYIIESSKRLEFVHSFYSDMRPMWANHNRL
jgi:hypothetical protein